MAVSQQVQDQVTSLYLTYFNRAPDASGFSYWANQIQSGAQSYNQVANSFYAASTIPGLTATQQAQKLYTNFLGVTPAATDPGVVYWATSLATTPFTTVATQFQAAIVAGGGAPLALVANKITVGEWFATVLASNDIAEANIAYTTVTADPASVVATENALTPGYTLTTNADTASSNKFTGNLVVTGGLVLQTLNNGDQLTGTGTNPTLNATILENGVVTNPASLAGLQTVNISFSTLGVGAPAASTLTLGGQGTAGTITSVNLSGATQADIINGLTTALTSASVSNTAANQTFTFADAALAGSANALTLAVNSVTGSAAINLNVTTAGASGYETINLVSNGSVTNVPVIATNGAGYSTLNVSGGTAITLATLANTITTLNASAATGVVTYTVAGGEAAQTITGGSANDVFNLAGTYTTADVINGGTGTANRLTMNTAQLTGATGTQANVTNIQVVGTAGSALNGIVNLAFWGATGFRYGVDSGNNNTINYSAGTGTLDFQNFDDNAAAGVTLGVNAAGVATNDVLNVTMGSTAAGTTFGNGAKTFTGFETVNILSQGAANTFGGNLVLTATAATETINVTGAQNFTVTGVVTADVLNASGMTGTATLTMTGGAAGAINVTGTANADTLSGSGAGDIISGGTGNDLISNQVAGTVRTSAGDVLTGGAGQDTFNLFGSNASAAFATVASTTSYVSDFSFSSAASATDIIGLSDTVNNYTAFGAALAGINGAVAVAGATVIQTLAQNTTQVATAANLVKITGGVATIGLTVQQIFDNAIGTGSITGYGANQTGQFVSVYDTTNNQALIMLATDGADTNLTATDAVQLVGIVNMSAADYAAFNNTALLMNA